MKHTKRIITLWKAKFLDLLRTSGNVTLAARGAGVSRTEIYELRHNEPEFAKAWDSAIEEAVELLEAVAWQRAKNQSDSLIMFLLKAYKSERFADRLRIEGNLNIMQVNELVRALTDAELDVKMVFNDMIVKALAMKAKQTVEK